MVDRNARDKLAEALRHLISGQLTNDEFDAAYPGSCQDPAMLAVWESACCLYDSGALFPYRLRGPYKVSPEVRRAAARAVVFLHSSLEYEWPARGGSIPFWGLHSVGCYGLLGLPMLLVAGAAAVVREWSTAVLFGAMAAGMLAPAVHWVATYRSRAEEERRFNSSGEVDLWPFIRREDYEAAIRNPRFLTGRRTA
jgi:hypothetical protein